MTGGLGVIAGTRDSAGRARPEFHIKRRVSAMGRIRLFVTILPDALRSTYPYFERAFNCNHCLVAGRDFLTR